MSGPKLFEEVPVATARDLLEQLMPHSGHRLWGAGWEEKAWLFRGQSDAEWGLTPSAMRSEALFRYQGAQREIPERTKLKIQDRLRREQKMVMDFVALADRSGHPLPGDTPELRAVAAADIKPHKFPTLEYRGLFALAQHYGVPTRFLDWTQRPLVAAYFAAVEAAKQLWHQSRGTPGEPPERCAIWALAARDLLRLEKCHDPSIALVSAPAAIIPNLAAQVGRFTLVYFRDQERADRADPPDVDQLIQQYELSEDDPSPPLLYKFTFPASEARRLLKQLSLLDVTAAQVFPGLLGVERAMRERNYMAEPACLKEG